MSTNGLKYVVIRDAILKDIESGAWPEGSRLPGEVELASKFSASRVTVARALRELQESGRVTRIGGSGTFVSVSAKRRGKQFGLLIPELGTTEIFEPICQGMMQSPQAAQHSLMWGNSALFGKTKHEQALHQCEHYIQQKVDGVFFAPVEHVEDKDSLNQQIVTMLRKANITVVLMDRCYMAFPERSALDLVGIDNRRAGHIATEHLLEHGCQRLIFLGVRKSANTVQARVAGFREAVLRRGLSLSKNRVSVLEEITDQAVEAVLDRYMPDGFVCANDFVAGMLMQCLERLGRRVPEDIRLTGIDDIKYAALLRVPLTTIHQPCVDIGRVALAAMLERLDNPTMPARDLLLPISLVVRKSCGHI